MEQKNRLGPTGEFPQGKVSESDEGGLNIGIAIWNSRIILNFAKPIAWIGLGPIEARALAAELTKKAAELDG